MRILSLIAVLEACVVFTTAAGDLLPTLYEHIPVGAIKPSGWAKATAHVQANGVAGQQKNFYSYVRNTTWTGGPIEYSDMRESEPYWFNGIVALAFQLENQTLIDQATSFMDYVIDHQQSDGWLTPELPHADGSMRLAWPTYLILMGMMQYAEASSKDTERILDSMHAFISLAHELWTAHTYDISTGPTFDYQMARWEEFVYVLQWVYDNHPRGKEDLLLDTMRLVKANGLDWQNDWYTPAAFTQEPVTIKTNFTHGVNIAESLKSEALSYRFTHDEKDIQNTIDRIDMIYKYHGQVSGTFAADEHLAGLNPSRGAETCALVEQMFSLALIYQSFGNNTVADRAEKIAYNALPGALTHDFWSHQYDSQINQVWSRNMTGEQPFVTNSGYANVYGLEPFYPCCAVNFPQGYPKFWANSLVTDAAGGTLVHALLGPATFSGTLKRGSKVSVQIDTNYPFGSELTYTIKASKDFSFAIRVPEWAKTSVSNISINGKGKKTLVPDAVSSLHAIAVKAGTTTLKVELDMPTLVEQRMSGAVAVHRGPLTYAVEVSYNDTVMPAWRNPPSLDYVLTLPNIPANESSNFTTPGEDHILLPTTAWELAIDPSTLVVHTDDSAEIQQYAWAPGASPVTMTAKGCVIAWGVELDTAAAPPASPNICVGDVQDVKLVPFGNAKLRIAEIPTVVLS